MSAQTRNLSNGSESGGIVVASHPRSGTHLIIDLLRRQFVGCAPSGLRMPFADVPYWNLDDLVSTAGAQIDREIVRLDAVRRPIFKTHRRPDFFANCQYTSQVIPERMAFTSAVKDSAVHIFVYRDVIAVMKSLYSMVEPEGGASFGAFIREVRGPLSRVGWWARHLVEWRNAERTLTVAYAALLRDPAAEIERIGRFLVRRRSCARRFCRGVPRHGMSSGSSGCCRFTARARP